MGEVQPIGKVQPYVNIVISTYFLSVYVYDITEGLST